MANISEMELQNLRHLLLFNENDKAKYEDYASQSQDNHVKQFFQKTSQSCTENKQTLMKFLQ